MMKNAVRILLSIVMIFVVSESIAMVISIARLKDQLSVREIERIEVRGFSGLNIVVRIDNRSRFDVSMGEARATILQGERAIATISQVKSATAPALKEESIVTQWKIEAADPTSLLMLASKISKNDYTSLTLDYTSKLSVGRYSKTMRDEGVDITKFLTEFTSQ